MMCRNKCLNGDIWKIVPKLSLLHFLIWSTDTVDEEANYSYGLISYLFGYKMKFSPL